MSSKDSVEFLEYVAQRYKLRLTHEDFELLYNQFKKSQANKSESITSQPSIAPENSVRECPFIVSSRKAACGLKLKKNQTYCIRHEKTLANRAGKKLLKSLPKEVVNDNEIENETGREKMLSEDITKNYLLSNEGKVTHRRSASGSGRAKPLNQQDIDFCEKHNLSYREPELDDFLDPCDADKDVEQLEDQIHGLTLQK